MFPLRVGASEQFALLNSFLKECGYTEKNICERLGVHAMYELVGNLPAARFNPGANDAFSLLIRLLLLAEYLPPSQVEALVPAAVVQAMRSLGVLCEERSGPATVYGPMACYPAEGHYYVANDFTPSSLCHIGYFCR